MEDKPLFYLAGLDGTPLVHSYYAEELKLLPEGPEPRQTVKVKNVLRSRIVNGEKQLYCSFEFYPRSMRTWVKESALIGD